MTNETILKRSMEKAVENWYGWNYTDLPIYHHAGRQIYVVDRDGGNEPLTSKDPEFFKLIFSHGFAKAFWGEEEVDIQTSYTKKRHKDVLKKLRSEGNVAIIKRWGIDGTQVNWKHHLQQMVLCIHPIKYLEKFL